MADVDEPTRAAVRELIAQVRAVPITATALTGPYWYGAGWKDAVDHLEEIADAWGDEAVVRDEFRVIFRRGSWVARIAVVGSEAAAMDRVRRAAVEEPDAVCEVVRVRTSRAVVWPPEGAGGETAPESPQDAPAHPETRETGGSAA